MALYAPILTRNTRLATELGQLQKFRQALELDLDGPEPPILPLEPPRVPGRAPAPPPQGPLPPTGTAITVSQTGAVPTPGFQPVPPLGGGGPQPLPFTDIPPQTSLEKIEALMLAGIVAPPEGAQTLPLGSIAAPRPNPADLNTLMIKREMGADTRELEAEAQRQADARRTEGLTYDEIGEAMEHVAQPFDVAIHTIAQSLAQAPKLFTGDFGEIEAPTLFDSGFNLVEGFRNARDEFKERPAWEQALLSLGDPSILVPFFGPGRRLITAGTLAARRALPKGAGAARGASQVDRALAAGVPGLPVSPPPQSLAGGLREKMRRLEELQEFGLKLDASANEYIAPLREMDDRIGEVITTEYPILRVILGDSGINPAIKRNTTVGRTITAYQMGRIEAEELTSVALAAAYDYHFAQGVRGRLGFTKHVLPVDRKTGFFGDTGKLWQDVFSKPDAPGLNLTQAQRALIDDYNQISNFEIPRLLDDAGITRSMRSNPEGQYYVFRDVQEIRGIEVRRHSISSLQRHYDEATEGFAQGVRYDTDPRRSLEFQLRWAQNKILRKQLDDVLEPLSVSSKELIPEAIQAARTNVLKEILELEKTHRAIRSMIRTTGAQGRTAAVRTGERVSRLQQLQREVGRLDDILVDLPQLKGVETEVMRVELGNARRGIRAAEVLLGTIGAELSRASQTLARVGGRQQGTVEELRRLDRQFDKLARLQDDLTSQPISQLLEGRAPIPGSPAAIRQAAARAGRFGAVSTQAVSTERTLAGAQRRFINLSDARAQLERQVAQLKDDVRVGRQLTTEASTRLRAATTGAIRREGERGRVKAAGTQARRQRARVVGQAGTRARRVASAEAMEFDIQVRRGILSGHLDNVEQKLTRAKVRRTSANRAYATAKEEAEVAGYAPGALFGPNQPLEIGIADWNRRFFTRPDADLLMDLLPPISAAATAKLATKLTARAIKTLEVLGNSIRFLSAVGDFAMPFIQGLPVLATNPNAWTRMTLRHYQAFLDPTVQARLIRDNISDFQWLAKHGVPIGDPEFFRALEAGEGFSPGRLLEFLPRGEEARRLARLGGKQFFGRFAASYNTGLGWSRALLYKSLKDSWKGTDGELARYIRNLTGGLDARALGVGPGQRAAEGMWMAFSPRLLRSTVALTIDAFKPGTVVGRSSLRSLATLATGAMSLFVLTGLALGKDWDEIKVGLNPLNGKRFLSHQINGDWIGVGGQVRAIAQLVAGGLVHPADLATLDRFQNPLLRFLGGRGAPIASVAEVTAEAITGRDFAPFEEIDGPLDVVTHIGKSALPFALQGILEGEGLAAVLAGFVGARTSEETDFEKRDAGRDRSRARLVERGDIPASTVGKEFRELDLDIQRQIDTDPQIQPLKEKVAELQTKRRRPIQLMTNALDKIDKKQDGLIAEAADKLGPSEAFRVIHSIHQRNRARDKETERGNHPEATQLIEEFEPSEAAFQKALSDYMEALNDPRLENEATGEYFFDLRDELVGKVGETHGDAMIGRILVFLHRNEDPLAVELRQDRELLRGYWDEAVQMVKDDFLAPDHAELWQKYRDMPMGSRQKQDFLERNKSVIGYAERTLRAIRDGIQQESTGLPDFPTVDSLLVKWEYDVTPETPEGAHTFESLLQGAAR